MATKTLRAEGQEVLQQLLLVWLDFERRLDQVPIIRRLHHGTFSLDDYRRLLFNLRPQVVEGARWITRAASSFTSDFLDIRATVIGHAGDEHRDYELLEQDFAAVGGEVEAIRRAPRNIGTEALAAYMLQQASLPNPIHMLGAMFIIEGLGNKMASHWALRIQELLHIPPTATRFLSYHGQNDDVHLDKLHYLLDTPAVDTAAIPPLVKTARVVARLYVLQLEELDHV